MESPLRGSRRSARNPGTRALGVLQQIVQVENAEENYKSLMTSARRTERLEAVGRATVVSVNQAVQEELSARNRWIDADEQYKNQLDAFKTLIVKFRGRTSDYQYL